MFLDIVHVILIAAMKPLIELFLVKHEDLVTTPVNQGIVVWIGRRLGYFVEMMERNSLLHVRVGLNVVASFFKALFVVPFVQFRSSKEDFLP